MKTSPGGVHWQKLGLTRRSMGRRNGMGRGRVAAVQFALDFSVFNGSTIFGVE
jgi:hypothetical protein